MLKISPAKGSRDQRKKRVGRGFSSGIGGRSTRGTKGQKARKSGNVRLGFEGGQMPLYRKVGKYGFNNYHFKRSIKAINLKYLENFKDLKKIDLEVLLQIGLICKHDKFVKFIGNKTSISEAEISVHAFSKQAEEILRKNNNKLNILS